MGERRVAVSEWNGNRWNQCAGVGYQVAYDWEITDNGTGIQWRYAMRVRGVRRQAARVFTTLEWVLAPVKQMPLRSNSAEKNQETV